MKKNAGKTHPVCHLDAIFSVHFETRSAGSVGRVRREFRRFFFFPWRLGCLENYGEHFHQHRFEGRKLWTTLGEAGNPGDTLEKI